MRASTKPAPDGRAAPPISAETRTRAAGLAIAAWLVPGAAHLLQGQTRKAIMFFVTLVAMFVIGIAAGGRLFPLDPSDPLVFLEAMAEWLIGLPRVVAGMGGYGEGRVTAVAYEYGNTFLIVSGLLNALVVLDAVDLARRRKQP